uniref:Uncharacterized protein n=1 Tax=Triticum urartu TaxID=4572 RepID=A0A8R7QAW5_TRIUA
MRYRISEASACMSRAPPEADAAAYSCLRARAWRAAARRWPRAWPWARRRALASVMSPARALATRSFSARCRFPARSVAAAARCSSRCRCLRARDRRADSRLDTLRRSLRSLSPSSPATATAPADPDDVPSSGDDVVMGRSGDSAPGVSRPPSDGDDVAMGTSSGDGAAGLSRPSSGDDVSMGRRSGDDDGAGTGDVCVGGASRPEARKARKASKSWSTSERAMALH